MRYGARTRHSSTIGSRVMRSAHTGHYSAQPIPVRKAWLAVRNSRLPGKVEAAVSQIVAPGRGVSRWLAIAVPEVAPAGAADRIVVVKARALIDGRSARLALRRDRVLSPAPAREADHPCRDCQFADRRSRTESSSARVTTR